MTSDAPAAVMEKRCQPDTDASVDFLRLFAPEGPWALTAIVPDRGGIETLTFRPESVDAMKAWLAKHNGRRNLYFHVNPTITDISKKARREDVKSLAWLHVDIDPRAGEDLAEEQVRCLDLLTDNLPKGIPKPDLHHLLRRRVSGLLAARGPTANKWRVGAIRECQALQHAAGNPVRSRQLP